jgi:hypothetical protein
MFVATALHQYLLKFQLLLSAMALFCRLSIELVYFWKDVYFFCFYGVLVAVGFICSMPYLPWD